MKLMVRQTSAMNGRSNMSEGAIYMQKTLGSPGTNQAQRSGARRRPVFCERGIMNTAAANTAVVQIAYTRDHIAQQERAVRNLCSRFERTLQLQSMTNRRRIIEAQVTGTPSCSAAR